jgi:hypothetical protein
MNGITAFKMKLLISSLVKLHNLVIPAKAGIQGKHRKTGFTLKDCENDRTRITELLLKG